MKAPRVGKYVVRLTCLAVAGIISSRGSSRVPQVLPDERILKVDAFFKSYNCPLPNHAADYVKAADLYDIDYRILPAISLLESTCGVFQRHNNHWGWNSARSGFPSVVHGIDHISRQLAQGRAYRDRDLDRKLYSYNPRPAYVSAAKRLMQKMN